MSYCQNEKTTTTNNTLLKDKRDIWIRATPYAMAGATGTAGTAMAVPLFAANEL